MKLDAILCHQQVFVINVRMGFIQQTPDKSFLVNNFVDFLYVRVKKKSRFCPVVNGVLLQQHLLLCSVKYLFMHVQFSLYFTKINILDNKKETMVGRPKRAQLETMACNSNRTYK